VGALIYFLLTGAPVFGGNTVVEVCAAHLHSEVVKPSIRLDRPVPASLEAVLLACLEKAPANRPRDATALLARLDACDDIPAWTPDDARRWWLERATPAQKAPAVDLLASPALLTLDVALDVSRAPARAHR
jgi:eukaryotic-like serine/threonine-protein kinase